MLHYRMLVVLTIAATVAGTSTAAAQTAPVVKEDSPGLLKQAKVTPQAATASALARVPGGTVQSAELEKEKGRLIYSFDIKVAGKSGIDEVAVDALTGAVLGVEHETPAAEAKEAKADKAKAGKAAAAKASGVTGTPSTPKKPGA